MKPIFTRIVFFLILTVFYQAATAQTVVNLTSNTSTSIYPSGSICNDCIINISPGVTLTINSNCSCTTCTFSGGTVVMASGSNFALSGTDSFKNETVLVNQAFTSSTLTFYGDTVAFNATTSLTGGRVDIDSSRVSVNAALTLAEGTIYKDSLHLNNNLTFNNSVDSFAFSNIDVASGVNIAAAQSNIINSTFGFAGSSSMTIKNGMSSTGSNYYLAGTSAISSNNATTLSGDNIVMTGTTNSFTSGNGLTTTNADFTMNGSSGTLSAQSLTTTGGAITTASGSTVTVTNGASLSNTSTTLTGTTFGVQSLTTSNGSFSAYGGTVTSTNAANLTNTSTTLSSTTFGVQALTTTNGSFSASSSTVTSTYAVTLTGTTTTLTAANFSGQSLTTNNGSFYSTGSVVSSTFAASLTGTATSLVNTNFSDQSLTTSGGTLSLSNSTTSSTNAAQFTGTAITMTGTSSLTAQSATLSTAASLTMNGTSSLSVTNAYSTTGSNTYLNGNATLTSGSMSIASSSFFNIGGGSLDSTAYAHVSGGFSVDNTSTMAITNNNNYLYTTNSSLKTNNISCGGGSPENACATDYVYGCATIKNNAGTQCTVLALADITLTAVPAGTGAVNLSWSDGQSATADHYLVQRSSDNGDWTNLATVAAGGYTAGDYQFEDPAAPTGTDDYRIARVDQDGAVLYSAISSVTIAGATGAVGIGIYPNPATGHTFFITTPNTEQLTVNIFTVTGQLLSRQSLQGQVRYQLLLPSQLQPGNAVIVQAISRTGKQAFPLLLQ